MPQTQQQQDSEGLKRVEEKLDRLMSTLPDTYADQAQVDRRFTGLEALIHAIQTQIDTWQGIYRQETKWAVDEHNAITKGVEESERRVQNSVAETERRLMAELKTNTLITQDNRKFNKGNRITILLCTVGWILTLILFVAGVLIAHAWPK